MAKTSFESVLEYSRGRYEGNLEKTSFEIVLE